MFELALYIAIGLAFGALVTILVFRMFVKPNFGNKKDEELSQKLIESESNLRVANDRLTRLEETRGELQRDLEHQSRLNSELNAKLSSLSTLLDETQKQNIALQHEFTQQKDELKAKIESFQELSRNHAAVGMKAESLQGQLTKLTDEIEAYKNEVKTLQVSLSTSKERAVEFDKEKIGRASCRERV